MSTTRARCCTLPRLRCEVTATSSEPRFNARVAERLRDHTGYRAIQQLPGIGTS
ncbi:hypothetical protein [Streptomyces sp. YIM 121038]|uniref:hypothetical protein n=1 Tax=Streptomyces sp. YIM 121038 TaxID=2136401 RepID=UPI00148665BA|nr:hypothetical protein [Streptomyces sp. YIM 121038]